MTHGDVDGPDGPWRAPSPARPSAVPAVDGRKAEVPADDAQQVRLGQGRFDHDNRLRPFAGFDPGAKAGDQTVYAFLTDRALQDDAPGTAEDRLREIVHARVGGRIHTALVIGPGVQASGPERLLLAMARCLACGAVHGYGFYCGECRPDDAVARPADGSGVHPDGEARCVVVHGRDDAATVMPAAMEKSRLGSHDLAGRQPPAGACAA